MKRHWTRRFAALLALLLLALPLAACAPASGTNPPTISPEEGKQLLDAGAAVLVDVRTPEEFAEERIPGAINVPNEEIGDEPPALLPDKDATILLYCRTGNRTKDAGRKLLNMGYSNVLDMGGIVDWPYETETGAPAEEPAASPAESPAASPAESPSEGGTEEPTGILSAFTATDLDGNAVDATLFAGHTLTMINVWATTCGPCIQEMPDLAALNEAYADQGVQVVGLVSDVLGLDGSVSEAQVAEAQSIVEETGANYVHIVPSEDLFFLLQQIFAVPTTFFVDETGAQVGSTYLGSKSEAEWAAIVDELLGEAGA